MTSSNSPISESRTPHQDETIVNPAAPLQEVKKEPTFVKLAMRNMVSKGSKSLFHFALTTVGLLGLLVGLAFVTR
jgi:Protein of unknown function (DUF3285)